MSCRNCKQTHGLSGHIVISCGNYDPEPRVAVRDFLAAALPHVYDMTDIELEHAIGEMQRILHARRESAPGFTINGRDVTSPTVRRVL
ncbi:MAG TPA: hypothetical protein VEA38_14360 [Terriglobales bacterium]|nr:hypothetical protein [Terriglobales bacterium]